jgi:hypothetical protein
MAVRVGSNIALGLQGRGDDGVLERMVVALHMQLVDLTDGMYMVVIMGTSIVDQSCLVIVHPTWNNVKDTNTLLGETTIATMKSLAPNRVAMMPLLQVPDVTVVAVHFGLLAVCCQRFWWHPSIFAYYLTMAWHARYSIIETSVDVVSMTRPTVNDALKVLGIPEDLLTDSERRLVSCEKHV